MPNMMTSRGSIPETRPHNFLGLTPEEAGSETPRVVVVPVPYEATVSYGGGTREGPAAIIRASRQVELYDAEEDAEVYGQGIVTLDEIEPAVSGPEEMVDRLTSLARDIFAQGRIPVCLGGEHTVSLGFIRAAAERFPDLTVLALDAHADMRDEYQGSRYSHACVLRRALEAAPVAAAGLRSYSRQERDFIRERGLSPILARDMAGTWDWLPALVDGLGPHVYLTVDLDVFDPGLMPAVGTPEPGGLGWPEVIGLIRTAAARRRIVGFDLVELAPLPGQAAPDFIAARLAYKILTFILSS